MNLYAFVHNDPLTHFDEYGLLDWGQLDISSYDRYQSQLGSNHRIFNFGFNNARMFNAIFQAPLAPFNSFDFNSCTFNWSMPESYHSVDRWLDQKHQAINDRFFVNADFSNSHFQAASFATEAVLDQLKGGLPAKVVGGIFRVAGRAYSKLRNVGSHGSDYQSILRGNKAFQFFSKENSKLLALNADNFRKNLIRYILVPLESYPIFSFKRFTFPTILAGSYSLRIVTPPK